MAQKNDFYSVDELQNFSQKQLDEELISAVTNNRLDHVKTLHENYANLNARDGQSFVIAANKSHFEIFDYLLQNCSTPPAFAISRALEYFCEIKKKDSIERIIELNPKHISNQSYLFSSLAEDGNLEMLKFFHDKGFDIRQKDDWTFVQAARSGDVNTIKFMLETVGADIKTRDYSAFLNACSSGNLDAVKYLHKKGSKISAENNSAMYLAALHNHVDIIEYLHNNGLPFERKKEKQRPIIAAIDFGNLEAVQYFVENDIDINKNNGDALASAICKGDFKIVKYLVENGANIHVRDHEWRQKNKTSTKLADTFYKFVKRKERVPSYYPEYTCLSCAAQSGYVDIFNYLLDQGANIDGNDKQVFHHVMEGYYRAKQDNKRTKPFETILGTLLEKKPGIIFEEGRANIKSHYMRNVDTDKLIQDYPASETSQEQANQLLKAAASDYKWDKVKAIINQYDVDINTGNSTVIQQALRNDPDSQHWGSTESSSRDILKFMIDKGADTSLIQEKNPKLLFDLNRDDIEKEQEEKAEQLRIKQAKEQAAAEAVAKAKKAQIIDQMSQKPTVKLRKRR